MTLWVDVTSAAGLQPPPVGIVRVELSVTEALCEVDPDIQLCLYESPLGRFSAVPRSQLARITDRQRSTAEVAASLELDVERRDLRRAGGLEIFSPGDILFTCGVNWLPHIGNMSRLYAMQSLVGLRLIAMCHDIIPIKFPDLVPGMHLVYAPYMRELARHADHIVCPSECSRRDLVHWTQSEGERPPETSVIPLGSELRPSAREATSARVAEIATQRFLLQVSTIETRKQQEMLCHAYARLVDSNVADLPLLVLAGGIGHGGQQVIGQIAGDRRLAGRVIPLVGCSDTDLAVLYRSCLFTLYPSLYEGWGLPVAESLAHGKFCLCSDRGSLPEVGKAFVDYADPYAVEQWAEKIAYYVGTPNALAQRELDIRRDFVPTRWRESADHVLAVASRLGRQ